MVFEEFFEEAALETTEISTRVSYQSSAFQEGLEEYRPAFAGEDAVAEPSKVHLENHILTDTEAADSPALEDNGKDHFS